MCVHVCLYMYKLHVEGGRRAGNDFHEQASVNSGFQYSHKSPCNTQCLVTTIREKSLQRTSVYSHDGSPESKGDSVCGGDIDDSVKEIVVSLRVWYQVALVVHWL